MILKPLFEGRKVHSSALNALKDCLKKKFTSVRCDSSSASPQ